ncbi:MAG TPA: phage major capsid protein [Gaiellaceae bacterium]|nr:phage major capsid protein [Gaiellaceae bacterium]
MAVENIAATEEFSTTLLEMLSFESVVLRATKPIRTSMAEVAVPLIGDANAGWYDAGDEINDGSPDADFVTLTPKGVKTLSIIPNETLDDAAIDLGSAVGRKLVQAVGRKIDAGLLKGGDAKGPAGVTNFPHLPSVLGPVSYDSLVAAAALIREAGGSPEYAIISPSSLSDLQSETDGLNRPLITNDPEAGPSYTVAGLTLLVSPALDVGEGLVVDPAEFPTAIRKDVSLAVDASAKFTADSVAIRAVARVDGTVADPNGFCAITPS